MAATHDHGVPRAGIRHKRSLIVAFLLVVVFMVVEIVTGIATGSLALLSDAGHMATDALGLGMALAAISAADRATTGGRHTYGLYRLEILAALANAILLIVVAGYVLFEAARRIDQPPDVVSGPMLVVAILGLIVNLIAWRLLRVGAAESINVEGAYLEVLADLFGSVGVIVAALLIRFADWTWADPVFAVVIGVFILPRAWNLGRRSLQILLQAAPEGLDIEEVRSKLDAIAGVVEIHDLHVWTLTSEMDVATLHLVTDEATDPHPVLDQARDLLESDYGIAHATIQVEPDTHTGCAEVSW
ncbi:MAG: cation diffusion facilitator family transporter [Acidimicrobiia bacterium]|nr:cation diffusion facilitator family transporter [Acidimicrobiia bacterium]